MPEPSALRCPACGVVAGKSARFCSQCGSALQGMRWAADEPGAERRHLVVLFYDLVGSTTLASAMDPEDYADLIGAFQRHVTSVMVEHGGFTARYAGDGGLIYFGYPEASENDAEKAARAALAVVSRLPELSQQCGAALQIRIGIANGNTVLGDVLGTGGPFGLDIAGAVPNLAARLQASAEPDTVLVSHDVYRMLGNLFECRDLGFRAIRGLAEPVPVWQVLRPALFASRFEARTRQRPLPMIDRVLEIAQLTRLWGIARGGRGRTVLIEGEAGIGKSRLVAHLLEQTASERQDRQHFCCSPHQQATPLQPCIEQIERASGFSREDGPEIRRTKLEAALEGASPEHVALIGELLLVPMAPVEAVSAYLPQSRREATLEALLGVCIARAGRCPSLIVFEDAHWADPTSLELLGRLVRRVADLPILLVVTTRPGSAPEWRDSPHVERLSLDALVPEFGAALVRSIRDAVGLSRELVESIVARSDGVPLYLEEVTKAVLEGGQQAHGHAVPTSIHASLLGRLDRLGDVREVMEIAAVIGREFSLDLLGWVTGASQVALNRAMARLLKSGLVLQSGTSDAGEYRFKHALIQDAAYGRMVRARRRALHGRIARAVERHMPLVAIAQPQLLARHCSEAGLTQDAVVWWLRAGTQSMKRALASDALVQLQRAVALLETLPHDEWRDRHELELRIALGKAFMVTQGQASAGAGAAFDRARALCGQLGDSPHMTVVQFGQWTHSFLRGDIAGASALAEAMLARAQRRHDPISLLTAYYTSGYTSFAAGQFDAAQGFLERGLALYDPASLEHYTGMVVGNPRVLMRAYLSWSLMCKGELQLASDQAVEALVDARALGGFPWTLLQALSHVTFLRLTLDPGGADFAHLDEMQALADRHRVPYFQGVSLLLRGWAVGCRGQAETGLQLIDQSLKLQAGSDLYASTAARLGAEVQGNSEAPARGLAWIAQSIAIMERNGVRWDEAEIYRTQAELLCRNGQRDAAEQALRRAVSVARQQGAKLFEQRAETALAALLAKPSVGAEMA